MKRTVLATRVEVESVAVRGVVTRARIWCALVLSCGHAGWIEYPGFSKYLRYNKTRDGLLALDMSDYYWDNPDPPEPVPTEFDCDRCDRCRHCDAQPKGELVRIGNDLVDVDACLAPEVLDLNRSGVKTIACCCRHGERNDPFITISGRRAVLKALDMEYTAQKCKGTYSLYFILPKSVKGGVL